MPIYTAYVALATIEADDEREASQNPAIAAMPPDKLQLVRENESLQPKDIPVSGKLCKGYSFEVPLDSSEGLAYYRKCGWDGEIIGQQCDGDICSACGRIVKDRALGLVESESVKARYALLNPPGIWVLVQS